MKNPHISIVIPVYKAERYLQDCVGSLLAQTFPDFEIILVDDGSPDKSGDLCDELALGDERVSSYHKVNGGATSARRYGVEHAIGEWILFVDSDDTMPEGAIEDLVKHDDGITDIIAGTLFNKSKNSLKKTFTASPTLNKTQYIHLLLNRNTYYGPCSKLFRRLLFENFKWNEDPRVFQNEDLLMLVQLAVKTANPITISNDYVHYICANKEGSLSTRSMSYEGWKLLFDDLKKQIEKLVPLNALLFSDFVNYEIWSIYDCLLTQAINVPQDDFIRGLLLDAAKVSIDKKNQNVIKLLNCSFLRYLFCRYRMIKMRVKESLWLK